MNTPQCAQAIFNIHCTYPDDSDDFNKIFYYLNEIEELPENTLREVLQTVCSAPDHSKKIVFALNMLHRANFLNLESAQSIIEKPQYGYAIGFFTMFVFKVFQEITEDTFKRILELAEKWHSDLEQLEQLPWESILHFLERQNAEHIIIMFSEPNTTIGDISNYLTEVAKGNKQEILNEFPIQG